MNKNEAVELLKAGRDGIENFNKHREAGGDIPELNGVDLRGESLTLFYLDSVKPLIANLSQVHMSRANLSKAKMGAVSFNKATLQHANFQDAHLLHADFSGASLENAKFQGADLTGANLTGARLRDANFDGAILTGVKGMRLDGNNLEKVRFTPHIDEAWHILRRTYTGSAMLFHLILMMIFFSVLAFKSATWIGIGMAQQNMVSTLDKVEDSLRKKIELNRTVKRVDVTAEVNLEQLADVIADSKEKLLPSAARYPLWKVVLQVNQGWWSALLAVALLIYNLLRIVLTKFVGALREDEELTKHAPVWMADVLKPYSPPIKLLWESSRMFSALRTFLVSRSDGYALYWDLHCITRVLMWVAILSFLWHLWNWMHALVYIPSLN